MGALLISVGLTQVKTIKVWESKGENESAKSVGGSSLAVYIHVNSYIPVLEFQVKVLFWTDQSTVIVFSHMCAKRKDLFLQKVRLFPVQSTDPSEEKSEGKYCIHTSQVERWEGCPMVHCSFPNYFDSALDAWDCPRIHVSHSHPMYNTGSLGLPRNPLSPSNLVRVWQCKSFILGPSNPVSIYSWRPELEGFPGTIACSLA